MLFKKDVPSASFRRPPIKSGLHVMFNLMLMALMFSEIQSQGTSRSRTLTNPQIPKEQEFNENGINNVGSGNQTTAHGQAQGTSEVQTSDVIEGSNDITDGFIVDFRYERKSTFNSNITNRETNSSFLSNDLLL